MCRGKVVLKEGFELNEKIMDRLVPLINDQLVEANENIIQITEIGKSFLRNVCMAFDERLQQTKERENLFSQAI
jgi:oxygen-independent coproporphyrinogen-3 oxidase